MQGYLVSYAHQTGFGRMFMATHLAITEDVVMEWERKIAKGDAKGSVCILAFTKIDGAVKPGNVENSDKDK